LHDDEEVTEMIKKCPLKYRLQLAALNHHLRIQKSKERNLRENARDIMNKYTQKMMSVNLKSNELISGERVLNEEELNYAVRQLPSEEAQRDKILPQKLDKIPDYWIKVLMNCERINQDIFEVDYALLRKLKGLEYEPATENKFSFSISFCFEDNEFIFDEKLSVKCVMDNDGHQMIRIEATPPRWKEDKNFTKKVVQVRQQNKKTGEIRTIQKIGANHSFFNIFSSLHLKSTSLDQNEKIQRKMEEVHDRMIILRDEVLRYHFEYYLGFRKSPDAHLPNIHYDEEEKQPEKVHKENKNSPNKISPKKHSSPPEKKKTPKKEDDEKEKKKEKEGGCGVS